MGYVQFRNLFDKGFTPLKDESYLTNGYLDTVMDWIPGMKGIRLKDLPNFIRTTNPDDFMLHFVINEVVEKNRAASAIIFNTFDDLEKDVLEALSSIFPPIYTLGPLQLLLNQIPDNNLNSVKSNLWKEEPECLEWLNSKEPESVVYVNFGSITVMTPQQMIEFAWGLCNSMQTFLWIIRPDLVVGESAILPPEFVTQTKNRGFLASWCNQEQVLSHPAIGGFLTHCGWNSTLESLCGGVPLICWPFGGDQQINSRYSCTQWGVGMEIDTNVKRDEVEIQVTNLMEGEKGREMRMKAREWKKKAENAISSPNGSSYTNFQKMVSEVLLPK